MFSKIYNKLVTNSYRPYTMSKLNLWSITNQRHTNITTPSCLYLIGSMGAHRYTNLSTIRGRLGLATLTVSCAVLILYVLGTGAYITTLT